MSTWEFSLAYVLDKTLRKWALTLKLVQGKFVRVVEWRSGRIGLGVLDRLDGLHTGFCVHL